MEIKTAEEILQNYGLYNDRSIRLVSRGVTVADAMREYSGQFKITPEQQKQLDAFPAVLEALRECMSELYTIHSQYGDKQHARDHSSALVKSESAIKTYEDGV